MQRASLLQQDQTVVLAAQPVIDGRFEKAPGILDSVSNVNDAPLASGDAYSTAYRTPLTVVVSPALSGEVTLDPPGWIGAMHFQVRCT